jgi:D-xylulose reductase
MDMEQGALVEPVACAVQMTRVGNVRANQTIVVFGCGPIGVLCQKVSKVYGAKKVIGVDISQGRLDFAKAYGTDHVFLPPKKPADVKTEMEWSEQLAKMIKKKFDLGDGPDVVIEATGAASCIATGIHLTKKGGTYVQAGMGKDVCIPPPEFLSHVIFNTLPNTLLISGSQNVEFPITVACIRDLTIRGSIRYTTGCYPTAVDLVASGKIDVKPLVTNRFNFEDTKEAFQLVRSRQENVIKVLIKGVE